ncbi:hypothetical protein [Paractinoplanes toevensis]|uniref:Uncharacterized protein n=1 Tax=Paractinoplanes toevensis TaxID=571911 RepID=A0A919WAU7_9ACTN|nr:hypothetical protein [Actinoplanes toevensis]GIM96785.1 hypothetical protein Ato02nite_085780 [Actinoplanes toevensis]
MRRLAGRAAAVLGVAGSLAHLAMAGEHARHAPALTVGMLLLAVVCARCSVHLWRHPTDLVAWRDLVILAVVMTVMHLLAGGLPAAFLAVPVLQLALGLPSFLMPAASTLTQAPRLRGGRFR